MLIIVALIRLLLFAFGADATMKSQCMQLLLSIVRARSGNEDEQERKLQECELS